MGYGIIYVPAYIVCADLKLSEKDGYVPTDLYNKFENNAKGSSYLSYNFSNHSLCGRNFRDYMYLPDLAGHTTERIEEMLSKILDEQLSEFPPYIPEGTYETKDIYGNVVTKKIDGWARDMRVFTYHIKRLRDECKKYPRCLMIIDYDHPVRLTEDDMVMYEDDQKNEQTSDNKDNIPKIYYRHPTKGNVLVDNFSLCTEIYVITFTKKDPNASQWYELCWKMPDAPPKP